MKKHYFCLMTVLLFSTLAFGQLKKSRIGQNYKQIISLGAGINYPIMDIDSKISGYGDLSYTYLFIPKLGIRGQLGYSWFRGTSDTGPRNYYAHNVELSAQAVYNFFQYKGGRAENNAFTMAPERMYLFGGVGALCYLRDAVTYQPNFTTSFPIGLGIQWAISDRWGIGLEAAYHFTLADDIDYKSAPESFTDGFLTANLFFCYKIPNYSITPNQANSINKGNKNKRTSHRSSYKKAKRHMKCDPRKGCSFTFD